MNEDTLLTLTKEGGEKDFTMEFIQINLHHSRAATVVLSQKLAKGKADKALNQERWIQRGPNKKIMGQWEHFFSSGTQCSIKILCLCVE